MEEFLISFTKAFAIFFGLVLSLFIWAELRERYKGFQLKSKFNCPCGNSDLQNTIYITNKEGFRALICKECACYIEDGRDYLTDTDIIGRFHKADRWSKKAIKEQEAKNHALSLNNL